MMQAPDLRNGDESPLRWWLNFSRDRRVSTKRKMRAGFVVVLKVVVQNSSKVALVKHDHMVKTLSPY